MKKYDIIIIGGGPAGYVAAIRSAQLGKKTAIIESKHLGGICLNWGCIPTKSLLYNANVFEIISNANNYGIEVENVKVNWIKMIKRSRDVTKRLSKGIEYLLKKNKIDYIRANGKIVDAKHVETQDLEGKINKFECKKIIVATGARPKYFQSIEPDGHQIITSKEAMALEKQPKSLAIIGGGPIGVEFAHFFLTFGTEVTLIEALPNILPSEDIDISIELEKSFKQRDMKIFTNSSVQKVEKNKLAVSIHLDSGEIVKAEKVLIAIGVKANIENLGLKECGIEIKNNYIKVNEFMQTSVSSIYAIGDVIGPPWLAHVASAEAILSVEHIANLNPTPIEYNNIPGCTYCYPEVASVGLTEKLAIEKGYKIKVGKFPFKALGKSMATGHIVGFVKVIFDEKYGEMLGCHIIGSEATNMITEATIARQLETTHKSLLNTVHPHPTLSEAIFEATADALGEAIHI